MEASNLFSLFQIPYHTWIDISTIFAYKLNTPQPLLETMYMYDIIFQYNKLEEILKQENGEGDGINSYEEKANNYQNNMQSQMNDYKKHVSSSMPNISNIGNINFGNFSGFKMPKI